MRYLIVDNDEQNLKLLRLVLGNKGHEVAQARDGQQALDLARKTPPDVIISDILMPVMDGYVLCRIWHEDPALKGIPFIFYTATYTSVEDETLALSIGADAFIRKPTEPSVFVARVADILKALPQKPKPLPQVSMPQDTFMKLYNERLVKKLEHRTESLAASEERYRRLFESSLHAIFLADPESGLLLDANPAACELVGRPKTDLIGQPQSIIHPPRDMARYERVFKDRIQAGGGETSTDLFVQHADGRQIPVEVTSSVYETKRGRVIMGLFRDLTERKRAEEATQESEERLRLLYDNLAIGLYRTTPSGRILMANPALIQMLGYDSFADLAQRDLERDAAYEPSCPRSRFKELIERDGKVTGLESGWKKRDGTTIFVRENARAKRDAGGAIIYYEGSAEDITERKKAEEALRASEEKYRAIFEGVAEGIYVSTPEGRPLIGNPALMKMLGYKSVENMLARDIEVEGYVDPSERARFKAIMDRDGVVHDFMTQWLRPDGSSIHVIENARAIRNSEGTITAYEGSVRDITELKLAENALRASEETFRHFFENNPAASYIHSASGELLDCNQAFLDLFGFGSKQQALATSLVDRYIKPEEREIFRQELSREKRVALRETTYRRIDGTLVHVLETAAGIFDADGKLDRAVGFLIDVSERKLLEDQLRQAQKMEAVGQLAGGVAHDFNNILMAIQGASELLAKTVKRGQPGHKEVLTIRHAADRASTLTRQLLGFARKTMLETLPIDPNLLVEGMLPMLKRLLPETIRVDFIPAESIGHINADSVQLEQVLMNLCVNARDAMPDGGLLTIETESVLINGEYIETHPLAKPGRYVLLTVTDTGTGIRPEVLPKIFDPFFTTKHFGEGTGLGLSMAYGIVKQHGGAITAYTEMGIGTTFKIYLPMVESGTTSAGTDVAPVVKGGHETILVVEDDKEVRDVVVEVLKTLGYKVLTAGDGAEGLELLRRSEHVDLVLTDMIMPKMGGRELRAASHQINPSLRFLFTSGYTESTVHQYPFDKGVAFLAKPYGIDVLAHKVREMLDYKGEG